MKYVLSALVIVLSLVACKKAPAANLSAAAPGSQVTAPAPGQPAGPKPLPAVIPDVVAKVGTESISKADLESAVSEVAARAGGEIPADHRAEVYRGVLDQLIAIHLLTAESKTRSIPVSDADVDARLAQVKGQFPNEEAFNKALAGQGMTLAKAKEDARTSLQIEHLLQAEIAPKIQVSQVDLDKFYKENPEQFKQPESVRASHILIRPSGDTPAAKKQAHDKAEQLLKDAKGGSDFAALAKQNSQDPGSAPKGGDLGFFPEGQMVPEFDKAAFALKPGEISDLVETQFGYHIIKVAERKPARVVPLDEAKPQLEQFLQGRQREEKTSAFIDGLKARIRVEIFI